MTMGNTPPISQPTLPKTPWVQHVQLRRSDTPTSVYSNTHSPTMEAPNSPTTTNPSSPPIDVPSRGSSPTISPISSNNSSHTEFRSSRYQITPPHSPRNSAHSRPRRTRNHASRCKSTNFLVSKWGIGWKTPTIIISCYLLALATALIHLFLFIYISGKPAEGKDRVAPQTYISTASNLLANAFSFFLKTALTTSFVQYLWRLLRVQTMKVSTIDSLFGLKSNIFHMFKGATIRAAPVLCVMSAIMASMTIAVSFTPGAINVILVHKTSYDSILVPTFNASFMGNGSGVAANKYSLATLSPIFESGTRSVSGFTASDSLPGKNSNLLSRLAFQTMITGKAIDQPSPCGENCSFVIEFEGPSLECNSTSTNITTSHTGNSTTDFPFFTIYSGNWTTGLPSTQANVLANGTYTKAHWQSSTLTLLNSEIILTNSTLHPRSTTLNTSTTQNTLYCIPSRALYTINNTYISNILTRNITSTFISPLTNLMLSTPNNTVSVPGFANTSTMNSDYGFGTDPAEWSADARAYYRDLNFLVIIDTMFSYLAGEYTAMPAIWPLETEIDEESSRMGDRVTDEGWGESSFKFGDADAGMPGGMLFFIINYFFCLYFTLLLFQFQFQFQFRLSPTPSPTPSTKNPS
ncbi:4d2da6d9-d8d8-4646-be44-2d3992c008b1 [Sclerotinia trifoliorum]|uniref:4d2da6d9-d8d8-4646-be44-2d3992c008b1 n=1 Tax=Sclerotinia trifoliorum TaxID=28548 RepID=A0A8H2VPG8_9HELO|nr:4d2da6d9-d8d8-4646-be44-2d3992c008b1 [Sclerotinia trifoliorum]